jgi:hypothetical protein
VVIALFLVSTITLAFLPMERSRQRTVLLVSSIITAAALVAF